MTYRALRFYEDRGLLAPRHVEGRRIYGQDDRDKLQFIAWAERACFSIAEIGELIRERDRTAPGGPRRALLRRSRIETQLELLA
ncbi:MerR family transcriptional regulator, partial [Escherichia coli]|uniref:MerR family transcriptional regulator n=1 Tax=Escherichia coli TaxID=562 RepID=UPI003D6B2DCD